jgi:hypothetical protein
MERIVETVVYVGTLLAVQNRFVNGTAVYVGTLLAVQNRFVNGTAHSRQI